MAGSLWTCAYVPYNYSCLFFIKETFPVAKEGYVKSNTTRLSGFYFYGLPWQAVYVCFSERVFLGYFYALKMSATFFSICLCLRVMMIEFLLCNSF